MKYIKDLIAKFKKKFNINLDDRTISIIGIVVLVVILLGGIALYNVSRNEPLFGFIGRDTQDDDTFDDDDDEEESKDKNDKDKEKDDKDKNNSSSGNGEIYFEEPDDSGNEDNGQGGLTVTPDSGNSDSDDTDDEGFGMLF